MLSRDYILAPQIVQVRVALSPVLNVLESIQLLTEAEEISGLADWVIQTAAILPTDTLRKIKLVFYAFQPVAFEYVTPALVDEDFPRYMKELAAQNPYEVVESLWDKLAAAPTLYPEKWAQDKPIPTRDQIMISLDHYADFMNTIFADCGEDSLWEEAYELIQNPPKMLQFITGHLQMMYQEYVKAEWERVQPMLRESVAAFQRLDYSNMTVYEAIRAITGRDMTGKWDRRLEQAKQLIFVPTAHIGPYVGQYLWNDRLYILFTARLPKGIESPSSDLSRAELLIRLNALADDTRLKILELLTHNDELCAQDFIERLGLSQPTISRHLSQLSATGYITERRREVAKCYSLNTERMTDTLRALTHFLSRQ